MRHVSRVPNALAIMAAVCLAPQPLAGQADSALRVEGTVRSAVTGGPVSFAVVRVVGTVQSVLAGQEGQFLIEVPPGAWTLEVRKIGFRPATHYLTVLADTSGVVLGIAPIPLELAELTITGEYENPALAIIRQAIARKNDLLARIHDYRYDAYVKFVVRDLRKDPDSASSIVILTETQTAAYWEQPDRYQEVIRARRQSSNVDPENNLVSVGQIVNFNRDRIDIGRYSVVSPTADDALSHYDYQVIDTLWDGGRPVFRLAIEPRSDARPLFVGWIDVADSTFDVRAIDVGANSAVRFELFRNLRYRQRLGEVAPDAWMPTDIRFSGEVHIGMPIPGFPNNLSFVHTAHLDGFRFDEGRPPSTLGEYLIVVDQDADDADSTAWADVRATPLTALERSAWDRIDSLEHEPPPLGRRLFGWTLGAMWVVTNPDFFHFNRVEGPYLGAGLTLRGLSPDLVLRLKTGYGFEREEWAHRYGVRYRASEAQRVWLGVEYVNEIVPRPTAISAGTNTTLPAVWDKDDPLDYYHEEGFQFSAATKVLDYLTFRAGYLDVEHASVDVVTDYSIIDRDRPQRANPAIVDGRLRSLSASLTYDSRPRLKRKGRDFLLTGGPYTELTIGAEVAAPGLVANDFDFARYTLQARRRHRTLNLGVTTVDVAAGLAIGTVPTQRYFTVDFGRGGGLFHTDEGFNTLERDNYSGNRLFLLRVRHDFGRQLFAYVPLMRKLPLTLSVQGGFFVTDFEDHTPNPSDLLLLTASTPYTELGFGVGNLTPFLSPLNLAAWFVWQLSDYDTDRFVFAIGLPEFLGQ
jgi:hypothetical protein